MMDSLAQIKLGQNVVVLTTYLYRYTGKVKTIEPHWLTLENVSWIAETGRYSDAMHSGVMEEVEPEPEGGIKVFNMLHVGEITPVEWALPREQK